jgi:hypothetical protein
MPARLWIDALLEVIRCRQCFVSGIELNIFMRLRLLLEDGTSVIAPEIAVFAMLKAPHARFISRE